MMSVVDGSCLLPWLNRYSVGPSAAAHLDRICVGSLDLFLSLPEVLIAHLCGSEDLIQCANLGGSLVPSCGIYPLNLWILEQ